MEKSDLCNSNSSMCFQFIYGFLSCNPFHTTLTLLFFSRIGQLVLVQVRRILDLSVNLCRNTFSSPASVDFVQPFHCCSFDCSVSCCLRYLVHSYKQLHQLLLQFTPGYSDSRTLNRKYPFSHTFTYSTENLFLAFLSSKVTQGKEPSPCFIGFC